MVIYIKVEENNFNLGYWENDRANGEGTYISTEGANYHGVWKDDIQEGQGILFII